MPMLVAVNRFFSHGLQFSIVHLHCNLNMNHYFFINDIIFFSFAQLIEIQAPFIKIGFIHYLDSGANLAFASLILVNSYELKYPSMDEDKLQEPR
jgi:hypothetical protein